MDGTRKMEIEVTNRNGEVNLNGLATPIWDENL